MRQRHRALSVAASARAVAGTDPWPIHAWETENDRSFTGDQLEISRFTVPLPVDAVRRESGQ